jgi:L-ascorbate metabolism protein UlaG (beta-lactamase superfamily)
MSSALYVIKIFMNIRWHGNSCISIKSKSAKIFLDPQSVGLKGKEIDANLVLTSDADVEEDLNLAAEVSVFTWPGEYEATKVSVQIVPFEGKNILVFEVDDIKCCSLSNLSEKLSQEMVEKIGDVDVLFIPVGNNEKVLSVKDAIDVVESVEPRIVIPINFKSEKFGTDLSDAMPFFKEVGKPDIEPEQNYTIKEIPEDRTEYVYLKAN